MSEDETKANESPLSEEDIKKLSDDIDNAKSTLVSKETQSAIEKAKADAKAEAEKEFTTNQKIKELEEQKQQLEASVKAKEESAAQELEKLKQAVNEMKASKAVVQQDNPFQNAVAN